MRVAGVAPRVATPLRTGDLVRRLVRVRRGNAALRAAATPPAVPAYGRPTGLVAARRRAARPWLAPAAPCYVAITLYAAVRPPRPAGATRRGGATSPSRAAAARGPARVTAVVNLCFHGIGTPGAGHSSRARTPYWITDRRLPAGARRGGRAARGCGISFDDGNASDVEIGLPGCSSAG